MSVVVDRGRGSTTTNYEGLMMRVSCDTKRVNTMVTTCLEVVVHCPEEARAKNHISDETLNSRLRDLAREAGIELGNAKIRWHCFRKMIIWQAKNLGIDPDIIKVLVGKSVKKDVLTYMTGIDVKTAFKKLHEILGITAFTEESENIVKAMESKIKSFENAMIQLEHENQNFKTRIDLLQKEVKNLQEDIKGIYLINSQFR